MEFYVVTFKGFLKSTCTIHVQLTEFNLLAGQPIALFTYSAHTRSISTQLLPIQISNQLNWQSPAAVGLLLPSWLQQTNIQV